MNHQTMSVLAAVKGNALYNLAPLAAVRRALEALGYRSRGEQDLAIDHARRQGRVCAAAIEGRDGITDEELAASIPGDAGERLGYLMLRK